MNVALDKPMRRHNNPMTSASRDIFDITNRVVVITGGLGQLGRAYTHELLARGARVALLDMAEPDPDTAASIAEQDRLSFHRADVTDRANLETILAAIEAKWETPFGLINNAALDSPPGSEANANPPFEEVSREAWDATMEVNVTGVFHCCQVFGKAMRRAKRGAIVMIGSTYGMVSPDQRLYDYRRDQGEDFYKPVAYSASKSALINLARYLATHWAPHVRVNTLTLGGVFNHQDPEFLAGYEQRTPMGRMAQEDEYNGAIVFLMSDASAYMTGANLVMDGGWTAW